MPDGAFARFRIAESPITEPDQSGQTPDFRSYSGQGIDDPTATARFDWSSTGFHAQVISASTTVYVDPYAKGDTTNYITYDRKSFRKEGATFECLAHGTELAQRARSTGFAPNVGPNGTMLRSLRTAIAATGEYTKHFRQMGDDDNQAKMRAYDQIKITMDRVNGIWERGMAIRFVLLSKATELTIIYPNPATDPYTNGADAHTNSNNNQTNLDATIGTANYDIGHVFSVGGGGEGTAGVCQAGAQAAGATATNNPQGDPFDVDFVAHEVIHQFAGNHTFNEGNSDNCNAKNRSAAGAYEPGSGSTVASYAGICAAADLQVNSDDYFHSGSIDEVLAWVTANACATQTATGNTPPTVNAGPNFNIPRNTPFTLTATATDPDGDAITFAWEEFDLGAASPPDTDNGDRPLFRPYRPNISPSRTFPSLQYILNNANNPVQTIVVGQGTPFEHNGFSGENMPTTTRSMKFRVTVRDNRAGGGGINTAEMMVNVNANAGPFAVTSPNRAVSFAGNTQQTVTWSVAGTDNVPILTANVKISLSTDGGNSFPTVLAASTTNDGTEEVTIPNTATTTARIKVEAAGNIFFDISDTNFTITAAPSPMPTPTPTPTFGGGSTIVSSDFAPLRSSMAVDSFGDIYIAYDVSVSRSPTSGGGVLAISEIRLARSTDGGATFTLRAVASGQTRLPSLAVSAAGEVYISYLRGLPCDGAQDCSTRPASERASIVVVSSRDGGRTFSSPVQVSTPGVTNVDWETNIAVDGAGKVYVVWSETDTTDAAARSALSPNLVKIRTSSDGAQSFSTPVIIHGDPGFFQGDLFIRGSLTNSNIAVTPAGQIHVTWTECKTDFCLEYFYSRSLDGQTFSAPMLIDQKLPGFTFGGQDIAVDNAGRVSVVYEQDDGTRAFLRSNIYHARIENGVVTNRTNVSNMRPEFFATEPAVAIDGIGRIYVAWAGPRPEAPSRREPNDIFIRRSSDGGRSFSAPVNNSDTPSSSTGSGVSFSPALAIGLAGTPLVVWGDNVQFCSINCFSSSGELRFRRASAAVNVVDPNPRLIGNDGKIINDAGIAADIDVSRGGAVADGVSKLLIVVRSTSTLRLDLEGTGDLDPGKLYALGTSEEAASTSTSAVPQVTGNGESVVVVVYIPPASFGSTPGAQRPVNVRIRDGSSPDAGSIVISLTLERPPVVLVHGLWSKPDVWITGRFRDALESRGFVRDSIFLADYKSANAQTFDPTANIQTGILSVKAQITDALNKYRSRSIAATQADVVGHSMGGLMTRSLIQQPDYLQRDNFRRGSVHRLITIGTPHSGSQLSKLLYDNRDVIITFFGPSNLTVASVLSLAGQPIDQGAVRDLSTGSVAYSRLQTTAVKSHAIVAAWHPDGRASYTALEFLGGIVARDLNFDLDNLFGQPDHDTIVGATSQYGGLTRGGLSTTLVNSTIHAETVPGDITETDSNEIKQRVFELLSSSRAELFSDAFPAPPLSVANTAARESAESQTTRPATPTAAGTETIRITSPSSGTTFDHDANTSITLTAEAAGGASPRKMIFLVEGVGTFTAPISAPYTVSFNIPPHAPLGRINIVALALDATGVLLGDSANISLVQNPQSSPREIRVEPSELVLNIDSSRQLLVVGEFPWTSPSFVPKNITGSSLGTTYSARRGSEIVRVSAEGLLTAISGGVDTVEVRNGTHLVLVPVTVLPASDTPSPTPTPTPTPVGTHTISGRVTLGSGSGISQVTMTLQVGAQSSTAMTDASGNYSFNNLAAGGTYRVTPSKSRFSFSPQSQSFSNLTANRTADFTGVQVNIRGAFNGKIAFATSRHSVGTAINSEIYIMDADGRNQTRLTNNPANDFVPVWSPDGTRIAFATNRDGNFEIYVMNSDGTNQVRLTNNSANDFDPAWSPDGTRIAFTSNRLNSNSKIFVMNSDGSNVSVLSDSSDRDTQVVWSPDGARLAFTSDRDGNSEVYVINSDGTRPTRLTNNSARDSDPAWSPDGAKLVFTSRRDGNEEIYLMEASGLNQTRLTSNPGEDRRPTWSPDGAKIAFDRGFFGQPGISVMDADGTDVTRITEASDFDPDWQAVSVDPTPTPMTIQFASAVASVGENGVSATVTVSRLGNNSGVAAVDYATSDLGGLVNCNVPNTGAASSRCDYEITVGRLRFAAGETSKTISVPIIDDSYAEGIESFAITLSNATGASLGSPSTATVTITDNETANGTNPVDQAGFFVRLHYLDFLNREPDASGLAFWTDQITSCGTDTACVELRRINVSAAFFLSIEFQQTGYLVYRMYKAAYGKVPGTPVPVRLNEFLPDTQQIGQGVVVGQTGWEQVLENNKNAFAAEFVARSPFTGAYPTARTPEQFVDALFTNAGVTPPATERTAIINEFGGATNTADTAVRARVLRRVAENSLLAQQEFNKAFVLMQYLGYLRRNPNDAPDGNFDGYNFWLGKLNQFDGNFVNAEMVKAFIVSGEYKQRFGP